MQAALVTETPQHDAPTQLTSAHTRPTNHQPPAHQDQLHAWLWLKALLLALVALLAFIALLVSLITIVVATATSLLS